MKKAQSAGVVIQDDVGRVCLRRPTACYDGYAWTWPKGRVEGGQTKREAARREAIEETGYDVRIGTQISGRFESEWSVTTFFRATAIARNESLMDDETEAVKWATFEEAAKLITQGTNRIGMQRDLAVLLAAYQK